MVGGAEGAGLPAGRAAGGRGAGGAAAWSLLRLRPDLLQTHPLPGGGGRGGRGGGGQGEAAAAVRLQKGRGRCRVHVFVFTFYLMSRLEGFLKRFVSWRTLFIDCGLMAFALSKSEL